ncbi:glycosyltransferase family 22 protein [Plicaturopsis crispa FD-325 SS-3]|nr:glycosyltransferase family 22 protein [Plicaturopsis crispa FD-325 SS-3]
MKYATFLALCLRISVALFTRTFFQPDEYFQSLEPAHHLVFGYGHLTWEWLTPAPVRSVLYPALNVPVYWILKTLSLDSGWLMVAGPKILHGCFAALTDIWIRELSRNILGERYVSTTYFLSLTSFFHALSLSRSLSNSLETSLTTIALSFYPWEISGYSRSQTRVMIGFAALACAMRPTNGVIWIYMFSVLLWRLRREKIALLSFIFDVVLTGAVALISPTVLDTLYYGNPTLTPLNFLRTNLSPVSLFYGSSPLHYYLTQALPILCTTALPFVLHGTYLLSSLSKGRTACGCVAWTLAIYSLAGHKEWRFIHPLLPLLHIFAAKSLVDHFSDKASSEHAKERRSNDTLLPVRRRILVFLLLSVPASLYVIFFHGAAQISVVEYIRGIPELKSVGFLTPCHSTPAHAYIHRQELAPPGRMWALGCEPPLGLKGDDLIEYRGQSDVFFADPVAYITRYLPPGVDPSFPPSPRACSAPGTHTRDWWHEWPQYIVLFGALLEDFGVQDLLADKGYHEVQRYGKEWEGEGHRKGAVRVWMYSDT